MTLDEFKEMWGRRVVDKHERFRSRICKEDDHYFEVGDKGIECNATETCHPFSHPSMQRWIERLLTDPIDVTSELWQANISSGPLGTSGLIDLHDKEGSEGVDTDETVVAFRSHHAMADGVSLSAATNDAADESEIFHKQALEELAKLKRMKQSKNFWETLGRLFQYLMYMLLGSLTALSLQFWRMMTATSPFDDVIKKSSLPPGTRSVTWRYISSVNEVKVIAKAVGPSITINDVFVR